MKHIPFDFDWTFREGGERFFMFAGQEDGAPVDLPHDAIITKPRDPHAVSGASTGFFPGGDAFYRKAFDLPADCAGKTVLLLVDGAYMNSEVRLNGDLLYLHPYGYTAYTVDLTPKIAAHNVLTISTKCVQPNSRWYSGGGLYRNVSLLVGGACYVHPWDVFVTTPSVCAERAEVRAAFETTGTCGAYRIDMAVVDAAGETVASASGECFDPRAALSCFVEKPRLWDVDSPHLYTLRYTLTGENGVDAGETRFGIRKIEIDAKQGFRLNGKQMKLRGGCIHHDNAMLGACAFPAAERRKIQLLKDAGYNAVRTAHNPPSSALLDACDELGMLVLDETFDVWRTGKNAMDYHLWFEDWWRRDTSSMVKRDRNHPSIYAWSIGNEIPELLGASDGAKWAKAQADFVRALDSTRPVSASANGFVMPTPGKPRPSHDLRRELMGKPVRGLPKDGADDWGDQTRAAAESLDLYGYNYLYGRYAHDAQKFPDRAIHATETHAYHTYDYWKACVENENCFGDFIWTAYDNLGEAGAGRTVDSPDDLRGGLLGGWPWLSCWQGDLDLIGDARPQNFYRRVMWGVDRGIHLFAAHPARADKPAYGMGWHWDDVRREWTFEDEWLGKIARVQAYADCDLVEFFLNGASVAKVEPVEYKAHAEIPYARGVLEAVAYRGGREVARDRLITSGAPAQIALLPERTAIRADGMDIGFVRIELRDEHGNPATAFPARVTVEVSGAGSFAGLGSGNPCTEENFTNSRNTYNGVALACVRAARAPGRIALRVTADGLPPALLTLFVEP